MIRLGITKQVPVFRSALLWAFAIFLLSGAFVNAANVPVTPAGDGLTTDTAYQITELGNLVWMSQNAFASSGTYYKLINDIDASETANWNDGLTTGLVPIGTYSQNDGSFRGVFDGNQHKITTLTISQNANYVGLFGYIGAGGVVKKLGLEGGAVTGNKYVGGLAGENNGTIANCYATGAVTGSNWHVGGLVGHNYLGMITNCFATGAVTGSAWNTGGLVGLNENSTITNSFATGMVTGPYDTGGLMGCNYGDTIANCFATGAVTGIYYVGGLTGYNDNDIIANSFATGAVTATDPGCCYVGGLTGYNDIDGTITACYATGAVAGIGDNAGGLAGYNKGVITNCYATTGTVTNICYFAGGLNGYNQGTITNCYAATGAVTGNHNVGGLNGGSYHGTITNSYWDTQSTSMTTSDGGTSKTTTAMKLQATFTGWDFTNIWAISPSVNSGYPYLKATGFSNGVPGVFFFSINNGAAMTTSANVTLTNTCTGSPTVYMASEDASFTGATPQTYSTAPTFTLSGGYGVKTVYFKVSNSAGESSVMSATINFALPCSLTVNITPPSAVSAGAKWRRAGTSTWLDGGYTETGLTTGSRTVEFKDVPGFITPASITVELVSGQTTERTAAYTLANPGIQVTLDGRAIATTGTAPVDFGSVALKANATSKTFVFTNTGETPLLLSNFSLPSGFTTGTLPTGFTTSGTLPANIAPGTSQTLIVALNTSVPGVFKEVLSFDTNVAAAAGFEIPLMGSVASFTENTTPVGIKITYKNCTVNSFTSSTLDIQGSAKGTVKVEVLRSPIRITEWMRSRPGTLYLEASTGLTTVTVSGDLYSFYTMLPIQRLIVDGALKTLSASNVLVSEVQARSYSHVSMRLLSGSTTPAGTVAPQTRLRATGGTTSVKPQISLQGVGLAELYVPGQPAARVSVSTRKGRTRKIPFSQVNVSGTVMAGPNLLLSVSGGDVTGDIVAANISALQVRKSGVLGGHLGSKDGSSTGTWVITGVSGLGTPGTRHNTPDIEMFGATAGVNASFVCGVNNTTATLDTLTPNFSGQIKKITLGKDAPLIGQYWATAKALKITPSSTSVSGFRRMTTTSISR